MPRAWALTAGLLWAGVAAAAVEGPGRDQFLRAARASGPVAVDGRLDEETWARAPVFDAFVQRFPEAGKTPSERTELRVLYDDRNVYFAITCHDSEPALINRNLGRRDSDLYSDRVKVLLDTTHDHRTAYVFSVNAGGVQEDGLHYDDQNYTADWDGVWDGAAGRFEGGWVAELAIPLSLLRFPESPMQTWGFSVRRDIARRNEELESVLNPRTSGAIVSRLGHLTGMEVRPYRALELVPYLAARTVARPQFSDAARPWPRLVDPSLDVGLDLRTALTSNLALTATLNPDFGQVEADQLILNLSSFETFFPEKRTFFTQGMELFNQVGGADMPQTLFYSRRIGLQTPILGAAKLTGTVAEGVELGVLDAVVTGPWRRDVDEERPDRNVGLYLTRPLHLGPNSALPTDPMVPMNYLAAVVRGKVGTSSRVGGMVTMATPLTGRCTAEDAALDEELQPVPCLARGGNAAAVDFDLRTADGQYALMGQVDASQVVGGPPERTLRDGTVLRRGDTGLGGYVRAGKYGGEGFRWDVGDDFTTPRLDLNPSGFLRTQNEHAPRVALRYARPNGMGPLKSLSANMSGGSRWTTDGRGLNRGSWVNFNSTVQLPSFDTLAVETGADFGGWDVRELKNSGVPLENTSTAFLTILADSNENRPVVAGGSLAAAYHFRAGPVAPAWGWQADLYATVRPHPALETNLELFLDRTPTGPRFIKDLGAGRFLLSPLLSDTLSLTLRQQWVVTPKLTLQAYAQLFTTYGAYGTYYEGVSDAARTPIRFSSLRPVEHENTDDFHDVGLNLNVVLRWEYRLGSTLYVVYSRGQQRLPVADGVRPPHTLMPHGLLAGAANDALLVKWTWYWGV
ncbi:carbohydrate binding family 9 domain-containing protein [Archangium lipolyticum]|uniref:carbohydrate binding family 9 domain-containing protein n=1 Tax=Archangium lipolyticum TaxID=2970465 RepID=UPI002149E148|nr:carbohydrate binding family 9 domain-containing protein [Archangium lipolyticum]